VTGLRALGYRLFGRGFDYLLHLRPAEWPILTMHFLTGTALSIGVVGLAGTPHRGAIILGTIAFVIGLNGGTLALNSAFDRDTGDVAYLRRPPPPPPGLAGFGVALMVAGLLAALVLPRPFLVAYAICFLLSILYSVPPIRLKAVAGFDWAVNLVGFGFLTPYAGWALTARELSLPGGIVLLSFAALFGALYPLTQLYQLEEDRRRGDRTLAVSLGITRALGLALLLAGVAFLGFAAAANGSGWAQGGSRRAGLAAAALAWGAVLLPWWLGRARLDSAGHQRRMHWALLAWAVTDLAVLWAWAR